jgi:hypothetical protein
LARWQDKTDEPLLLAAVVFLAAYAIPIIHPELPPWLAAACRTTSLLVWGLFDPAIGHPGVCGAPGHPARRRRSRARLHVKRTNTCNGTNDGTSTERHGSARQPAMSEEEPEAIREVDADDARRSRIEHESIMMQKHSGRMAAVVVTHDAQLAAWADRIVLRDGRMTGHTTRPPGPESLLMPGEAR